MWFQLSASCKLLVENVALYDISGHSTVDSISYYNNYFVSACPSPGEDDNMTEIENMDALYFVAGQEVVPTASTPLNTWFVLDIDTDWLVNELQSRSRHRPWGWVITRPSQYGKGGSCLRWQCILLRWHPQSGHPCSCYPETWSPCPDTWGGVNQSSPGCTCLIMLDSKVVLWWRLRATVNLPCGKDIIVTFVERLSYLRHLFAFTL